MNLYHLTNIDDGKQTTDDRLRTKGQGFSDSFHFCELSLYLYQYPFMAFKFENLRVWQASLEFGEKINSIADEFPKKELFNLSTQIRRAADSIGLNIAEGSTGQSNTEQKRFLIFANRSALEVIACLIKARKRRYIDENTFTSLYNEAEHLVKMIQAFIKKLGE